MSKRFLVRIEKNNKRLVDLFTKDPSIKEKDFMKKQAIKFLEDLIIGLKDEKPETTNFTIDSNYHWRSVDEMINDVSDDEFKRHWNSRKGYVVPVEEFIEIINSENKKELFLAGRIYHENKIIRLWNGKLESLDLTYSFLEELGIEQEIKFDFPINEKERKTLTYEPTFTIGSLGKSIFVNDEELTAEEIFVHLKERKST